MQTKKLYIKSIQKLSFKAFAIIAFVCVFITQRIKFLNVRELEMSNVSDSFGISDAALGRLSKFFDYFGVGLTPGLETCTYLSLGLLVCGLAVLVMSFFGYRIVQIVNFIASFIGFVLSVVTGVIFTVISMQGLDGETGEIMSLSVNLIFVWLPALFFLIGSVFTYAYAKMPGYSLAEGRFFTTLGFALNPKYFVKTFRRHDDTENIFRTRVPLKKKKYATIREPKAIKTSKKAAQKSSDKEPVPNKKLTRLELALARREHAERVANVRADEENRALFMKKSEANVPRKSAQNNAAPKPVRKGRPSSASESAKALELAKRRAAHAEEVVSRNDEIFY